MHPYQEIVETVPIFFFIWDIQKKESIFISERFFHEYLDGHYEPDQHSKDLREYISPENREDYDAFFESLSPENNYRGSIELKAGDKLGKLEWLCLETYPIMKNGEVTRLAGHIRDISYEKQNYELLDEQVQSLDVVAFMLAHELSAPVSNIMGLADFLKHMVSEENAREHLHLFDTVYNFGGEILTLARGMVNLINLQVEKAQRIEKRDLPLRSFLENGLKEFYYRHQKSQIKVEVELTGELEIHADPDKLKWAIDELLLYLLKISGKKADIIISAPREENKHDDQICIYAENLDLPKEEIRKILQKSKRLELTDVTGRKISGMLELVIANEIVRLQGGQLSLYEKDNLEGIAIQLPRA